MKNEERKKLKIASFLLSSLFSFLFTLFLGGIFICCGNPIIKDILEPLEKRTVTFNSNGGSSVAPIKKIPTGTTINAPAPPTKDGFSFAGWYKEADINNEWDFATDIVTKNITLYAKWDISEVMMVFIPGGSFQMGSTGDKSDETPMHTVTLSGFYMGKYEVTQAQWKAVMGSNPSYFTSSPATGEIQDDCPVENVSWYDVIVFCNKLSMMEGLTPAYRIPGFNSTDPVDWGSVPTSSDNTWDAVEIVDGSTGYRLPTEAQWEYAARGGNGSPGNFTYAGSDTIDNVAWYLDNSGNKTHEVGKKAPNGLGLYDMSGNVFEWCWDWYGSYSSSAQTDPIGTSFGSDRVERGGSWGSDAEYVRSAYRGIYYPNCRLNFIGFRLVRP